MRKNYKYLMILIFILNFTNIYSQSNNYVYTWYNQSISTLYIDKQLLESTTSMLSQYFSTLSQYLGPLEPIILKILPYLIENLPILVSFFALFFMSRRFLNILNSQVPESEKLITSLVISIPLTFFFWPFVIPILIIAFIIKVFRIGKSKLESFKEKLGKINPKLKDLFSRAISYIKDFDKDTNKILKDINKINKIITYPDIRNLLDDTEKDIKTLKNMIYHLLEEAENEKLKLYRLKVYSLHFNEIYKNAINNINRLNEIINNMINNPPLLRRIGNRIFRTNKFTSNYLRELINIVKDLNTRLNAIYDEGQKTFKYLDGLLNSAEATIKKYESEINNDLKGISNNKALLLLGNKGKPLIREIQKVGNTVVAIDNDPRISPFEKVEILSKMKESVNEFKKNPKKNTKLVKDISKISKKR